MLYSAAFSPYFSNVSKPLAFFFSATVTDESFGVSLDKFVTDKVWTPKRALLVNLMALGEGEEVLSVSEALSLVGGVVKKLPRLVVEGEVSGSRPPKGPRGHLYFDVKDDGASMELLSDEEPSRVRGVFANEDGYQTPKMDSRAVIFDEDDRICLVREGDDRWSLPGGWVDTGRTVFSNVVKEAREEAGLDVVPERLIAVEEHNLHNPRPFAWGIAKFFVICRSLGGDFEQNSETTARGFFSRNRLPDLYVEKNSLEQLHMMKKAETSLVPGAVFRIWSAGRRVLAVEWHGVAARQYGGSQVVVSERNTEALCAS